MIPLSPKQCAVLRELGDLNPEADIEEVARLMRNRFRIDGKGPIQWESLEECVQSFFPLAVDPGKAILYYRNGVWNRNGEDEIARLVIELLGQDGKQEYATSVIQRLRLNRHEIDGIGPKRFMNFRNGMLDLKTFELLPHSPKYESTVQLQVDWNPDAESPNFRAWLNSTIDPDLHEVLMQIIGAAICPGSPFQKAVALIGPGGNGKGTLERTIRKMLPRRAASSVDIADLASNRFAAADLYGATANLCGDIRPFSIQDTALFKKLIGEDVIRAERKFGQPFEFTSEAFHIFSGNVMPTSSDSTEGWARRWFIVPLDRSIPGPFDSSVEARMQTPEELEGIARIATEALVRALGRGGFSEPAACKRVMDAYRLQCNSVLAFIEDELVVCDVMSESAPFLSRARVLSAYKTYCSRAELSPSSANSLYEGILRAGKGRVSEKSRSAKHAPDSGRGFEGLQLRQQVPMYQV